MKEYKAERLIRNMTSSIESINNSLNIAALSDWELVCVSEGMAYYVRESKANAIEAATNTEKGAGNR